MLIYYTDIINEYGARGWAFSEDGGPVEIEVGVTARQLAAVVRRFPAPMCTKLTRNSLAAAHQAFR